MCKYLHVPLILYLQVSSCFSQSAGIFNKLRVRKDKVPIRPLMEGKLNVILKQMKVWFYFVEVYTAR
jgi:hypothetical protein